jgi:glycosyltransferase involved in cell wall biosynthesis
MPEEIYYWIDHTPRFEVNSGIQRVTRCLARALEELGQEVIYLHWSSKHQAPARSPDNELQKLALWGGPTFRPRGAKDVPLHEEVGGRAGFWRNWLVIPEIPHHSNRGRDLTLALVDYARCSGLRIAFIFYDLIPITLRGYEDVRRPYERYTELVTLSDMVIPISRHSAREFGRYCANTLKLTPHEMPQISPILLADEFAGHARVEIISEPSEGPIKILSLGLVEPRKNQLKLLEAFNAFCREHRGLDVQLTLIGRFHPGASTEVRRLASVNPKVELVSEHLPEEAIVDQFRASHFSVFPSVDEGYGLPVAESLWLGKPCLCANFGSMAEIAEGGGCLTVDMRSVDEMKEGLASLTLDANLRRKLAHEAATRRMRLWRDYATDVLATLESNEGKHRIFYRFDEIVDNRSLMRRSARTVRFALGRLVGAAAKAVLPEVGPSIDSVVRRVPAIRRRLRPCIAFLTPYPPDPTGAADYIARLLLEVCRFADVDVFTDAVRPQCQGGVRLAGPISGFPRMRRTYDATVPVVGNSFFHKRILGLVRDFGGTCIVYDSNLAGLAELIHGRNGFGKLAPRFRKQPLSPGRTALDGLLRSDSLFFDDIVYAAQRLILHARELQAKVKAQYGVETECLPLCPRLEFEDNELSEGSRKSARERLGIAHDQIMIASFGAVRSEKAPADCILALRRLHHRRADAHLYFVGSPGSYAGPLRDLAREIGIEPLVHFMDGRVSPEVYRDYLIAADAAIQLRADGPGALAHALMDTIAAGLPAVANCAQAAWVEAPSYVCRVRDAADPALVADQLVCLLEEKQDPRQTNDERNEYKRARSFARYAEGLKQILGFG